MATALQRKKHCLRWFIQSVFYRFIDCVAASLLQILYEKWRRHFFPTFAFPGRFLAFTYPHLSDCISANIEPWNQQKTPGGYMTNALQQKKTPFVLIHPVCLLSFHRLRCRLTSSDPLQTLLLPFCPAIAFPGKFLASAYPHLSGCNSAYTESWNQQINS